MPEFPTWNSELDDRSVVLNSLKSEISQFRVSSGFECGRSHGGLTAWHMLNICPFKLGKETLKPNLDHTPTPLNSRLVIVLHRLQLATDFFQTTHCSICDFQLVV